MRRISRKLFYSDVLSIAIFMGCKFAILEIANIYWRMAEIVWSEDNFIAAAIAYKGCLIAGSHIKRKTITQRWPSAGVRKGGGFQFLEQSLRTGLCAGQFPCQHPAIRRPVRRFVM